MHETAEGKMKKKELEDHILELLATSKGNVLADEKLITSLTKSKSISEEIETRLRYAKATEEKINSNRAAFEPVAVRASHIYLLIVMLSGLDPVYQFSLEWFISKIL